MSCHHATLVTLLAKPVIKLIIYHVTDWQTRLISQNKSKCPSWLEQNKEKRHGKKHTNNWVRISFHASVYGSVPVLSMFNSA